MHIHTKSLKWVCNNYAYKSDHYEQRTAQRTLDLRAGGTFHVHNKSIMEHVRSSAKFGLSPL